SRPTSCAGWIRSTRTAPTFAPSAASSRRGGGGSAISGSRRKGRGSGAAPPSSRSRKNCGSRRRLPKAAVAGSPGWGTDRGKGGRGRRGGGPPETAGAGVRGGAPIKKEGIATDDDAHWVLRATRLPSNSRLPAAHIQAACTHE